jgi:hypothetical protein
VSGHEHDQDGQDHCEIRYLILHCLFSKVSRSCRFHPKHLAIPVRAKKVNKLLIQRFTGIFIPAKSKVYKKSFGNNDVTPEKAQPARLAFTINGSAVNNLGDAGPIETRTACILARLNTMIRVILRIFSPQFGTRPLSTRCWLLPPRIGQGPQRTRRATARHRMSHYQRALVLLDNSAGKKGAPVRKFRTARPV